MTYQRVLQISMWWRYVAVRPLPRLAPGREMQAKIVKTCDRIVRTPVFPLFDLQKETANMLGFLLMMAMGLWWIVVGIVASGLLSYYSDYECPGPNARSQPPQRDLVGSAR